MVHFDDATHTYTDDIGILPSVTQIIGDLGLKNTSFYAPGSANNGKEIHRLIHNYNIGTLNWEEVKEEHVGYLLGWIEYSKKQETDTGFKVWTSEHIIGHPGKRYAGTIDSTFKKTNICRICDVKTGKKEKWHKLQVVGYTDLIQSLISTQTLGYETKIPCIVYLKEDGSFKEEAMNKEEFFYMVNLWNSCINLYYWKRR